MLAEPIAFVADVHVGNLAASNPLIGGPMLSGVNGRCREALAALTEACQQAQAAKARALVVCGDLFDTARPSPQVISATIDAFEPFRGRVVLLLGNHEAVSNAQGDHGLGPMERAGCTVVEAPDRLRIGDADVLCVPYLRDGGVLDAVRSLGPGNGRPTVVAVHVGVEDAETPAWLQGSGVPAPALQAAAHGVGAAAVFAGDWHAREAHVGPLATVLQVGALAPTGWSNPGLTGYGTLALWYGERDIRVTELPGPRFITMRSSEPALSAYEGARPLRVKVIADAGHLALGEHCPGVIVCESAEPIEEARLKVREAANAVRRAETLDEALAGYVGAMELPEGVERPRVAKLAAGYLARAGDET